MVICLETLNIRGMLKNRNLSKKIQEKSWHMFVNILEENAEERGRTIIHIDQCYPSSKTCHKCQHVKKDLKQSEQRWTCPQCNTIHHRDINAAKNILLEGLKEQNK